MFASRLASGQSEDVLLSMFERLAGQEEHVELFACLLQEMVLRRGGVSATPAVMGVHEMLRERDHPLAYLPLALVEPENYLGQYLHHYGPRSSSAQTAYGPSRTVAQPLPVGAGEARTALAEVVDPAASDIGAAVREWQDESNGKAEIRVFQAASSLHESDVSLGLVRSLGLNCLEGAGDDLRAELVPANRALSVLFSAASAGGAYSSGLFGAYGRLACWRSAAAMVGASRTERFDEVAEATRRCTWIEFHTAAPWFYQVAWDVGLIAIRPYRQSLAVLAATDTD